MTRPVSEILEELEGLREKATALPWALDDEDASNVISVHPNSYIEGLNTYRNTALAGSPNNAALIVALVNAFPALKEEIERLRGALEFYAEKQNYVDGPSISDSVYCPYYPILDDRGDRAREVLEDQNAD